MGARTASTHMEGTRKALFFGIALFLTHLFRKWPACVAGGSVEKPKILFAGRIPMEVAEVSMPPHDSSSAWHYPFVVRGGASRWPAKGKWDPAYFARTFPRIGEVRVVKLAVEDARRGISPYRRLESSGIVNMKFSDACRLIERAKTSSENTTASEDSENMYSYYIYQITAPALISEEHYRAGTLLSDVNFGELRSFQRQHKFPFHPPLALHRHFESSSLWIGTRGTRSGLHFDTSDNFHAILSGSKTVALFPPGDAPFLYPRPEAPVQSQIDPLFPRVTDEFPLVEHTRPQVVTLAAGDVLFIPQLWWHWVESNSVTVSLNWWHFHPSIWWRPTHAPLSILRSQGLTKSLNLFRSIAFDPSALYKFYMGAGAPMVCRSWYSLAHGFAEIVLYGKPEELEEISNMKSSWRSVGSPPSTLKDYGAERAFQALSQKLVRSERDRMYSLNPFSCEDGYNTDVVESFRMSFRDGIVLPLLKKLEEFEEFKLQEHDIQKTLMDTIVLIREIVFPNLKCRQKGLLDELFRVDGGGRAWRHCEGVERVDQEDLVEKKSEL